MHLAGVTEEGTPLRFAQVFFQDFIAVALTGFFGVCQPMFSQHVCLLPFQEIKAVRARLRDHFSELPRRHISYFCFWMKLDSVEHFIFDDVTYP
jgi:hypothetical protein